jgi:hypothetical protein
MKALRNSPEFAALVEASLRKPVLKVSIQTGEVIAEYPSIVDAAADVDCCFSRLGKVIKWGRTCAGFRWVYSSEKLRATCAPWAPPRALTSKRAAAFSKARSKPVLQLSLSGEKVISEFASITAAALAVGQSAFAIQKALFELGPCGGSRWKYKDSAGNHTPSPPARNYNRPSKTKPDRPHEKH